MNGVRVTPYFIRRRIAEVALYYGFEFSELQQSAIVAAWGLFWVINPAAAGMEPYRELWYPLVPLVPVGVWGAVFVLAGIYVLYGLVFDVLSHRKRALFAVFILWAFMALQSVHSFFIAAYAPLFWVFAASSAWTFVRIRRSIP